MTYSVPGAALAPTATGLPSPGHLRRLLVIAVAIALAFTLIAVTAPPPTQAAGSDADRVVAYAKSHLGKRFRMGATGMRYFDCSGLVFRVYAQANLLRKIGDSRKRAASYFSWFKRRGLASRTNPRQGDVIWWTQNGKIVHMGLYTGSGQALSALINPWGVRRHSVTGLRRVKLLAFGHTRLSN